MVIDPGAAFLWCLLLLTLPLNWLLGAVLAAAVHELCHVAVLLLLGYSPGTMRIGITGIRLDIPELPYAAEALCAAAGPVGSFSLLLLRRWYPQLCVCAFFQGAFNLLPLYPLDGGRILRALALLVMPRDIAVILCNCVTALVLVAAFLLTCCLGYGKMAVILPLFLVLPRVMGKIPCKPRHLGVQ